MQESHKTISIALWSLSRLLYRFQFTRNAKKNRIESTIYRLRNAGVRMSTYQVRDISIWYFGIILDLRSLNTAIPTYQPHSQDISHQKLLNIKQMVFPEHTDLNNSCRCWNRIIIGTQNPNIGLDHFTFAYTRKWTPNFRVKRNAQYKQKHVPNTLESQKQQPYHINTHRYTLILVHKKSNNTATRKG